MITNSLIDRIITFLDEDITHIGIGLGNEPAETDILLDGEALRKPSTNTIDDNTLVSDAYWDTSEANGVNYINAGCFGNGATNDLNTGTLFAGSIINITKNSTESLTISIEITVEAVNT